MTRFELYKSTTTPTDIAGYWSGEACVWKDHTPLGGEIIPAVRTFISPILLPLAGKGRMLDVCSGAGCLEYCPPSVKPEMITAMDISTAMLNLNQASEKKVGDVREGIPFQDSTFAVVTMFFGWSHLKYHPCNIWTHEMVPQAKQLYEFVLEEVKRVLRPGGAFVIIDVADGYMKETGTRKFNYSDIKVLAEEARFINVKGGNVFKKETHGIYYSAISQIDYLHCQKEGDLY